MVESIVMIKHCHFHFNEFMHKKYQDLDNHDIPSSPCKSIPDLDIVRIDIHEFIFIVFPPNSVHRAINLHFFIALRKFCVVFFVIGLGPDYFEIWLNIEGNCENVIYIYIIIYIY
jgi:hypothetical protein